MRLSDVRIRDPYVIEPEPGRFVLFGTTDANVWGGPATGFDCYTSSDLESWEGPIAAFRPPEGFWSTSQFWAPEVHAHAGRFFMFATFLDSTTRVRGVAVLVADAATGPFLPWSDGPVTPVGVPCLDGTFFVDDDSPWLIYSRGAEGTAAGEPAIADGEMYALRLSEDLTAAVGEPELLFRASAAPWARPMRLPGGGEPPAELRLATDPLFTDGPFLTRTPSETLLMLWSSFGEEGYAMGVARSESGGIRGPWTQTPEPLWSRNGGHGMILHTSDGSDYLVFHAPNDSPHERAVLVPVSTDGDAYRV
ncbi:glycoside hydrolase family 43 protein [Salinibacterium sp. SYSU T00001]|uniref:glycoside hydrolase family 43 protein n=1 Tax=Homoserinimonas sedimenticola TaxID=2986805 RepID=UPI0022362FA3|nr:glycoside hydrolase family 43 protein [Salinibacterium sedimenticola]MCW4386234.1 glycoside hydrolase family 43 protein [Salinibacterium sedimenticola]